MSFTYLPTYPIHQFHQNIWVGLWIGWQKMLMGLIALYRVVAPTPDTPGRDRVSADRIRIIIAKETGCFI
ncbi:MAG: hypothetical protein WAK17_01760 [Candidatus Nitrosopolaris sp.]